MHDDDEQTIDTGFEHIGDTEVIVNNDEPDTEIQAALPEEEKTNPSLPIRLAQFASIFDTVKRH